MIVLNKLFALCLLSTARDALGQRRSSPYNYPSPAPRRTRGLQEGTPGPGATPSPTQMPTQVPTPSPTEVPETPGPTEVPETPSPTEVPETPGPTMNPTPSPTLAPTPAPTTPGPTPSPTLSPTPSPTFSKAPTLAPTPAPTPPPTFSFNSYCERPYALANESDIPCVEMVTTVDVVSGVGAFYDEEGCQWQERGGSVVGCSLRGIDNCRLCVFNRELYSATILDGQPVPFVDCPCCVPKLYEMGGDIDCDFDVSAAPIPTPVNQPPPTAAPVTKTPTAAPAGSGGNNGDRSAVSDTTEAPAAATTPAPTVPPIPMEPCERGAGGAMGVNETLCVDLTSPLDRENGIGAYYEQGCQGRGCNILDMNDCRQCLFDRVAFAASGQEGAEELVDCPCCVPITYKTFPEETECVWPVTPVPTSSPTTLAQLLANGATRGGRGHGSPPDSYMGLSAGTIGAMWIAGCVMVMAF